MTSAHAGPTRSNEERILAAGPAVAVGGADIVVEDIRAKLADTMPRVTVPTPLIHPTTDTEIRRWQAAEISAASGAADCTLVELPGAPHYLEGHRPEANGGRVPYNYDLDRRPHAVARARSSLTPPPMKLKPPSHVWTI